MVQLTFSAAMVSSRTICIIFKKLDAEVLVKAEFRENVIFVFDNLVEWLSRTDWLHTFERAQYKIVLLTKFGQNPFDSSLISYVPLFVSSCGHFV